jgi:formate dehydrogenase subunit delta
VISETQAHIATGPEKLIRMATEIADYFKAYPETKAAEEIASHINHFWTPKMREAFLVAASAPEYRLSPLLLAASERIKPKKTK